MFATERRRYSALLAILLLTVSCGESGVQPPAGDDGEPVVPVPTTLSVELSITTLTWLGQTVSFAVTVRDQQGRVMSGPVVSVTSSDEGVLRVEGTGVNPRIIAVAEGEAVLAISSGGLSETRNLLVEQAAARIEVSPSSLVLTALGETVTLDATVEDEGGAPMDRSVAWASSDESVVVVDEAGTVQAVANGQTEVSALFEGLETTASVTVSQLAATFSVSPDSLTLSPGAVGQATASAEDALGNAVDASGIVWESDPAVATVDDDGTITGVAAGKTEVVAALGELWDTVFVRVLPEPPVVTEIEVAPADATIVVLGQSLQMTATVLDQNGEAIHGLPVDWASSDESVVDITATGFATAVGLGQATITASRDGVTGTAAIDVPRRPTTLVVSPEADTASSRDETMQFGAVVRDQVGTPIAGLALDWSSRDEAVVTVSADGLATANDDGESWIVAAVSGVADSARAVVARVAVAIGLSDDALNLAIGESVQVTAEYLDANDHPLAGGPLTWSSDDPAVATVADDGTVTAVGSGSTTVRVEGQGLSTELGVTVSNIFEGTYEIRSQADVDAFEAAGYEGIRGDLLIVGLDLTELSGLGSLQWVEGSLQIVGNPNLESVSGLQNVESAGAVVFKNNPLLVNAPLPSLVSASSVSLAFEGLGPDGTVLTALEESGGILVVPDLPGTVQLRALARVNGLITAREAGTLEGLAFPVLVCAEGIDLFQSGIESFSAPALRRLPPDCDTPGVGPHGPGLVVQGAANLTELMLPDLEEAGRVVLVGNASLTAISLPSLSFVENLLAVDGHPNLTTLDGGALTSGRLRIGENPLVTTLGGLQNAQTLTELVVSGNAGLTEVVFPSLTGVEGVLSLGDNGGVRSIAFPELETAGSVEIFEEDALTDLSMPSLAIVGDEISEGRFALRNNALLANLSLGITTLSNTLLVTFNPSLPDLDAFSGLDTRLQTLDISFNDALTDISGLLGLGDRFGVDPIVTGHLVIMGNAIADPEAFVSALEAKFAGDAFPGGVNVTPVSPRGGG